MHLSVLLHLLLATVTHSVLFSIPVSLDGQELPMLSYVGGSDIAQTVASYLIKNQINTDQDMTNAINKRLISELNIRASDVEGKQELFKVPFTLGKETFELPIYEKMSVLLLASNFCVTHVSILDESGISVGQCCETVIMMTDEIHDRLLKVSKHPQ